jgi:hypothetical protein
VRVLTSAAYILKLQIIHANLAWPCAKMTCKFMKHSIFLFSTKAPKHMCVEETTNGFRKTG